MTTLIVGGGPAGSTAAILLARAGRPVTVLERETGPHESVCGEFLSAEACDTLCRLKLDPVSLGGQPIDTLRLSRRNRTVTTTLPFRAIGLSRAVLDEALLARATAEGADVRRGVRVGRLAPGWIAETSAGAVTGTRVLLATGKSDLRGVERVTRPPERLIGFRTHLAISAETARALRGAVEVAVLSHGYAGLQLVGDATANLCLLVEREHFLRLKSDFAALLDDISGDCTLLGTRLLGAVAERPSSIFRVPYGHVHRENAADPSGLYRLGDQVAVIPSFCGDGIAIALHSGERAAAAVVAGMSAAAYHAAMRRDVGGGVALAFRLYRLARTPVGSRALMAACALWPGLMRATARATRVRGRSLEWSTG